MDICGVTMDEFVELRGYITAALKNSGQDIPEWAIAEKLITFGELFPGGLGAMNRFIDWMNTHGYTEHEILPALVHDLNDMQDDGFSPRTSSY